MTRREYNNTVKALSDNLFRFAMHHLRIEEDASDIVQDCFMKLWDNRKKIDSQKVTKWLFVTANNAIIDCAKRKQKRPQVDIEESHKLSSDFDNYDTKNILDFCLDQLPSEQKSIILLRDLEGYDYKQIGEILELTESQVKVYLFRARKKFQSIYNAQLTTNKA